MIKRSLFLAWMVAPWLVACGDSGTENETEEVVELFSWWTSGGEREALDSVLDLHKQRYPHTEVLNIVQAGNVEAAREMLQNRMDAGNPPELFQSNYGLALKYWLDRNPDTPALRALDELATETGIMDTMPPEVLNMVTFDGHVVAIPANVHRENVLYYNKAVFDEIGMDPPTTLEEFYEVGAALQALDPPITPLAVGTKEPWTLSLTFFPNVLLSTAGPDYYQKFFAGEASPDDAEVLAALEEFVKIWEYTNSDAVSRTWSEAADLVATGSAAMTIMGDWTKAYFEQVDMVPDVDFGELPFVGTKGIYVVAGDCFPLTTDAVNPESGADLLRTWASAEGQHDFNKLKGSIPARSDVDISDYDAQLQAKVAAFKSDALIPSVRVVAPPAFDENVSAALRDMVEAADVEIGLEALRDNYSLIEP